jgi:hypothetical protein
MSSGLRSSEADQVSRNPLLTQSLPNMQVPINLHKGLFITTYWSMSGTLLFAAIMRPAARALA